MKKKISLVERRQERLRQLNTTASLRAWLRENDGGDSEQATAVTLERTNGGHGCTLDVQLTEKQIQTLRSLFPSQKQEIPGVASMDFQREDHGPAVFRFNFQPTLSLQMLTIRDVCHILKISPSTLRKNVRSRALRSFKVGNHRRFLLEDVQSFLQQCKSTE